MFDLETATDFSYAGSEPENLYFRRLAVAYHAANVDLRIHAYREKVVKLLNYFLGKTKVDGDCDPLRFNNLVRDALRKQRLGRVAALLNGLERDFAVKTALERRKLFVHHNSGPAWAGRNWQMFAPATRIEEHITSDSGSRGLVQLMNFGEVLKEARREIDDLCERLAKFRYDLVTELKRPWR